MNTQRRGAEDAEDVEEIEYRDYQCWSPVLVTAFGKSILLAVTPNKLGFLRVLCVLRASALGLRFSTSPKHSYDPGKPSPDKARRCMRRERHDSMHLVP